MRSPLVSRPAYGDGRAAIPTSESKLPQGDPGGKGTPLDPGIPGSATYSKPEEDIRETDKAEPGSTYRVDGPDDLAKPQDNPEGDERHHEQFKPNINGPGLRPPEDTTITKYPYRDDHSDAHFASMEFVAGCYLLKTAREVILHPSPMSRTAATLGEMTQGLDPKTQEKAATCSVTVKRADIPNLRWLFLVNCGNGAKVVRVKATREGNVVRFAKLDLAVSCSCPAWQWTGPEHHAKRDEYLDGKPAGTASAPVVRDPEGKHTVCKHVAAVLSFTKGWSVPRKG